MILAKFLFKNGLSAKSMLIIALLFAGGCGVKKPPLPAFSTPELYGEPTPTPFPKKK